MYDLKINLNKVVLPKGWMSYLHDDELAFYLPEFRNNKVHIEKQLVFKGTSEIYAYMHDFLVPIENFENIKIKLKYPLCLKDISQSIEAINSSKICLGGPSLNDFPGKN